MKCVLEYKYEWLGHRSTEQEPASFQKSLIYAGAAMRPHVLDIDLPERRSLSVWLWKHVSNSQ